MQFLAIDLNCELFKMQPYFYITKTYANIQNFSNLIYIYSTFFCNF